MTDVQVPAASRSSAAPKKGSITMKARLFAVALAFGVSAMAQVANAGPTHLTDAQQARMSECVDQQSGSGTPGAPDTCKEFKPGARGRTVLTEAEKDRMSECLDQQSGQGTAGAPDACAGFVHHKSGRR